MRELRNAYNVLVGKPEGKALGRPNRRWGGIRLDLWGIVREGGFGMNASG
jgi:hypothetical protein